MSDQLYHRSVFGLLERLCQLWVENGLDGELSLMSRFKQVKAAPHKAAPDERALIVSVQNTASPAQWDAVDDLFQELVSDPDSVRSKGLDLARQVWSHLDLCGFDDADALVNDYQDFLNVEHYESAKDKRRAKFESDKQAALEAKRKEEHARELEKKAKLRAKRREELKEKRAQITATLDQALRVSVQHADKVQPEIDPSGLVDYSRLKIDYVHKWLCERSDGDFPEPEQSSAVADMHHSYLLRARAGSGKTAVITAKARFLLEHEALDPDQLMILAFNTKAADEITKRICTEQGIDSFANARTFHSLAYQIVGQPKNILGNAKTGNTQEQTAFVQKLVRSVLNPVIKAQIYLFFRQEIKELENVGAFLTDADYYTYRRNHVQDTLKGEPVKSIGEKWLADFLFENGIHYCYEPTYRWDTGQKGNYRPDFGIKHNGYWSVVIEHWGIDLEDSARQVPADWAKSWQDYRDQIDEKRAYWARYNEKRPGRPVLFLESSEAQRRNGREAFEAYLTDLLTRAGIELNPLSEADLHQNVVITRIARFSTMCLSYIQKAKKHRLDPAAMSKRTSDSEATYLRKSSFLRVANNIYKRYEKELEKQNLTDFDSLMDDAIKKVHENLGNCEFESKDGRYVNLNELRWIMIDEYQDFSRLFYELIDAIRTYNPSVRLFCVGDNWQAINGFAGSDLCYFDQFEDYVPDAQYGLLRNNYRSAPQIIDLGNRFMQGKGDGSLAFNKDSVGRPNVVPLNKEYVQVRPGERFAKEREADEKFFVWNERDGIRQQLDKDLIAAKTLKACNKILTDSKYGHQTKFAILSRVKSLNWLYPDMKAFKKKLLSTVQTTDSSPLPNISDRLHCGTVHAYKGGEADVVILLGVNDRNFPKIHPDNELYTIFGVTEADVLAEEERLFYVALTRAKKDLYLLTDEEEGSEFLERLGLLQSQTAQVYGGPRVVDELVDDEIPF